MNLVFFGTPEYVLPILASLDKNFKESGGGAPIVAVVTQKPRPAGRSQKLTYSPVDTWARNRKIPVYYNPEDLIKNKVKADIGVLAAYGALIPKFVIGHLSFDILNVHPSPLPSWRGASPVQAAIIAGENETGVTIIKIDAEIDHGPIISQFKELIYPSDTTGILRERLFEKSAMVLTALIPPYVGGRITPRLQEHEKATFTTLLKKDHGFIPPEYLSTTFKGETFKGKWKIGFMKMKSSQASLIKDYSLVPSTSTLERFIRAMHPWPIAWTLLRQGFGGQAKRLKILKAHLEEERLVLDEVQLEGKNPVSWKQFSQAYPKATFE